VGRGWRLTLTMVGMPPAWANFGVGSWIERRARVAPDRVALVGGDRSFTYAELASRVRRLANGLQRLGVGRGDRVAWLGPNHPAFLEALFASGLVGAALAPVNHRLAPDGILLAMEGHRVTVGFGNPDLLDALARSGAWPEVDLSSVRFVVTGGAPVPERLIRAWLDRGVLLLQGYGLSEAAPLALLLDPTSALARMGSASRPPLAGRHPDRTSGRDGGRAGGDRRAAGARPQRHGRVLEATRGHPRGPVGGGLAGRRSRPGVCGAGHRSGDLGLRTAASGCPPGTHLGEIRGSPAQELSGQAATGAAPRAPRSRQSHLRRFP
jgi:AMP-binding enzyme